MRRLLCTLMLATPLTSTSAAIGSSRAPAINLAHDGQGDRKAIGATVKSAHFVGATSERFTGGSTRAAMTRACNLQFRASRMAFSDEYALTFNPPSVQEAAWVQPRVAFGQSSPGTAPFFYDQAGNRVSPEVNCGSWTSDTGIGTVLLPSGALSDAFTGEPCASAHPVACVAGDARP